MQSRLLLVVRMCILVVRLRAILEDRDIHHDTTANQRLNATLNPTRTNKDSDWSVSRKGAAKLGGGGPSMKESSARKAADDVVWMPQQPDSTPSHTFQQAFLNNSNNYYSASDVLNGCPIPSQLSLSLQTWTIQTHDINSSPKTVRGDEFYISHRHPDNTTRIIATSNTTDHGDGTYGLSFTTSPFLDNRDVSGIPQRGVLVIWLEYSCGVGGMLRPYRDGWSHNGAALTNWNAMNVPRPSPMRVFRPLNTDGVDLGQYSTVIAVGDTVMEDCVSPKHHEYHYPNLGYDNNPRLPFLNKTLLNNCLERTRERLRHAYSARDNNHSDTNAALLIGSGTIELQNPYEIMETGGPASPGEEFDDFLFEDHTNAIEALVVGLRRDFPTLSICWRLVETMHLHAAKRNGWQRIFRLRYMSQPCTHRLCLVQREKLAELGVPVLDLYEATYLIADRKLAANDPFRYGKEANRMMISWHYPHGMKNESSRAA